MKPNNRNRLRHRFVGQPNRQDFKSPETFVSQPAENVSLLDRKKSVIGIDVWTPKPKSYVPKGDRVLNLAPQGDRNL